MRRVAVSSGAVVAVGYDAATNELEVEFTGGDVYRYSMVPPSVHRALLAAESIGGYVNREIKPSYPAREVFER